MAEIDAEDNVARGNPSEGRGGSEAEALGGEICWRGVTARRRNPSEGQLLKGASSGGWRTAQAERGIAMGKLAKGTRKADGGTVTARAVMAQARADQRRVVYTRTAEPRRMKAGRRAREGRGQRSLTAGRRARERQRRKEQPEKGCAEGGRSSDARGCLEEEGAQA